MQLDSDRSFSKSHLDGRDQSFSCSEPGGKPPVFCLAFALVDFGATDDETWFNQSTMTCGKSNIKVPSPKGHWLSSPSSSLNVGLMDTNNMQPRLYKANGSASALSDLAITPTYTHSTSPNTSSKEYY